MFLSHPLLLSCFFLFSCVAVFPPPDASLCPAIPGSSHHPSPPASPLRLFRSAGTNTRHCTEASAQASRLGNPSPFDKNASILRLHSAWSGWVRAACRNSCSGSDQKKGRDFFDYQLFVHPPLKLSCSGRPLSEWAAGQGNARGSNDMLIGARLHLHLCLSLSHLINLNYNICKRLSAHDTLISQHSSWPPHLFVTVSLGAYHRRMNA